MHSAVLVAAALSGIVPVGLNPVRRGTALARYRARRLPAGVVRSGLRGGGRRRAGRRAISTSMHRRGLQNSPTTPDRSSRRPHRILPTCSRVHLGHQRRPQSRPVQSRQGRRRRDDAGAAVRPRTGGPLLRDHADVPFQRGAGRLGRRLGAQGSLILPEVLGVAVLARRPPLRRDIRANYVGKPLSYVMATPERADDADSPLRVVYGNEGAQGYRRVRTPVRDGGHRQFGSSEGGVAISRTPDTPPDALGPLPGRSRSSMSTPVSPARPG